MFYLGNKFKTVSHIKLVSIILLLISALGCKPKTSVRSFKGNYLIYSVNSVNVDVPTGG